MTRSRILVFILLVCLPLLAQAATSAFTYQGRLTETGAAPTGAYDLQFTLFDALTGGAQVGTSVTIAGVAVSKGLFTIALDFGATSFPGDDRWLAIAVKPAGGETYTTLSPRQPLTPTPYALFARGVNWADIVGRPSSFGLYQAGSGLTLTGDTFSISTGAITDSMIAGLAWSKLTGVPTTFAPGGAAGGDLMGTYPNPTVGTAKITNAKLAADAASLAQVSGGVMTSTGSAVSLTNSAYHTGYILDAVGNVKLGGSGGSGPDPSATLDVRADAEAALMSSSDVGQAFIGGRTGYLAKIAIKSDQPFTGARFRLYEGEGVGGTLIYTQSNVSLPGTGWQSINLEVPPPVVAGHRYTLRIDGADMVLRLYLHPYFFTAQLLDGSFYDSGIACEFFDLLLETYVQTIAPGQPTTTLIVKEGTVGINTLTPSASATLDVNGLVKMNGFQLGSSATAGQLLTANASGVGTWQTLTIPTSLPPSGTAGGDLTGTYPNPTITTGAVTTTKIADSAVTNAKLATNAVTTTKITDAHITTAKLADGAVTDAKIAGMAYSKLTGAPTIPTALPPSGAAGGDLTGAYPNPTVGAGTIDNTKLALDATSLAKVTNNGMKMNGTNVGLGTATAGFPLTFADVAGAKISFYGQSGNHTGIGISATALQLYTNSNAANIAFGYGSSASFTETMRIQGNGNVGIGTAAPGAKLDVAGTTKMTGFQLGTTATAGHVLTTSATGVGAWQALPAAPTTLPPSGAAGGDLTGTYPNPTVGAGKITGTKLADNGVTNTKLASDAAALAKVSGGVMTSTGSAIGVNAATPDAGFLLDVRGDAEFGSQMMPGPDPSAAVDLDNQDATEDHANSDIGQSFTAGRSGYLAKIAVYSLNTAVSGLRLRIYQGNGFTGTVLYTQANVGWDGSWHPIVNLDLPVAITAGQQYTLRFDGNTMRYLVSLSAYSSDFPGGLLYENGVATVNDLCFTTYVQTMAPVYNRPLVVQGGAVGINTSAPGSGLAFDVRGKAKVTGFQLGASATNGQVLTADATGTGSWKALPAAPTTLPPSGAAGGDLTGTYPNPTLAANAVGNSKLASDGASLSKVSGGNVAVSGTNVGIGTASPTTKLDVVGTAKMTGFQLGTTATSGQVLTTNATGVGTWQALPAAPTTLPPSGAAGGDLAGAYPNPTIAASAVGNGKLASDSASLSKVSGGNVVVNGANVGIGTVSPAAKLDINGTAKMTGFQLGAAATAGQVLTAGANGTGTWQALPTALPPSGAAGGDLTGSYPSPTIATNAVTNGKLANDAASLAKVTGGLASIATRTETLSIDQGGELGFPALKVFGEFQCSDQVVTPSGGLITDQSFKMDIGAAYGLPYATMFGQTFYTNYGNAYLTRITVRTDAAFSNATLTIYDGSSVSSENVIYQQTGISAPATTGNFLTIDLTYPVPIAALHSYTFALSGPTMYLRVKHPTAPPYDRGPMWYNGQIQNTESLEFSTGISIGATKTTTPVIATCQGKVGIGTTTPTFKLHVDGTFGVETVPSGDYQNVQWNSATGQFYQDSSSKRYKENITPLVDDFAKLLAAEPKTYTRPGAPGRWEIGYIAEEIDTLGLKHLVLYDQDGRPDGLNYDKMVLYLVEIAKDQRKREAEKDAQTSALQTQLDKLQADNAAMLALLAQMQARLAALDAAKQ
jgi:hypothetical protein